MNTFIAATAASAIVCALFTCYFLPSIIAVVRHHRNTMAIVLLNLFFGWTMLGWVIAMMMATWQSERA